MDTRFWGPSGWQLLHYIAFKSEHPQEFLKGIQDVLPCKFCRESTAEFARTMHLTGDPGKWMYDIHNMVNSKLRNQSKTDPSVIDPGPDPSFESVKKHYDTLKLTQVPGRDFLFSIATNYPDAPTQQQVQVQRTFLWRLEKVYPIQNVFSDAPAPTLGNRKAYMKWMYERLCDVAKRLGVSIPSFKAYAHRTMSYKSGCAKKTYRKKTCRSVKKRDTRKTYRVSHAALCIKRTRDERA